MLKILIPALVIMLLPLYMIAPGKRRRHMDAWRGACFAHRGLYGNSVPENSLAAFERACSAGFGIELDVQRTADGELVVLHDSDLLRMTGDTRAVAEMTLEQIRTLRLLDGSMIPTFQEVLDCIRGCVPLLVELKNGRKNAQLCAGVMDLLANYKGVYLIESFQPLILLWLRMHAPAVLRGQLVGSREDYLEKYGALVAWLLPNMLMNFIGRPDFIAYNAEAADMRPVDRQRRLFKTPLAAWTVRDEKTFQSCMRRGEMPIFEGFVPEKDA